VHFLITGAPNAYIWSPEATRCAVIRRQILTDLVEFWFGSRVCVANALDSGWGEETQSLWMDTEFINGRPAALRHPFSAPRDTESAQLAKHVMRPLQSRLAEAGFDGLVWQAGRGNPVATNNFLRSDGLEAESWAWIDLESGVPALIPANPVDLLLFYLPKSLRHRRALFDDVDVDKLRRYVRDCRSDLIAAIGCDRIGAMEARIDLLEAEQHRWRSMPRVVRGIRYRLSQGQITEQRADWYQDRPLRWQTRELMLALKTALRNAGRLVRRLARRVVRFDYVGAIAATFRYMISQRYRSQLAHAYVRMRVDRWVHRGHLSRNEAQFLRDALHREAVGSYITDFGVHVAIKLPIKLLQWGLVPVLFASGLIGPTTSAALVAFGGMIGRTFYTLGRCVPALFRRERLPWIALGVGLVPVIGNAAYPVQIVSRSTEREGKLAAFILYDSVTAVGELMPIWGGRDTGTEHRFNRLGDLFVRYRHPLSARGVGRVPRRFSHPPDTREVRST
jgi:hypothetical protein